MSSMHIGLAGEYTFTRRNADTLEVIEVSGPFPNLITNKGLDRLGSEGYTRGVCYVGTGSTPPSNFDASLQAFLASTNNIINQQSVTEQVAPYSFRHSRTFRFDRGAAAGNLSEVGVGWSFPQSDGLFSRALIRDSNGNPVTITVLANEILDVTYTLRYYPVLTTSTYNVTISGVTYAVTAKAGGVQGARAWSGRPIQVTYVDAYEGASLSSNVEGLIQGTYRGGAVVTPLPYVTGSYTKSATAVWNENTGNGMINGFALQTSTDATDEVTSYTQFLVSPALSKDNTKTLTLQFSVSWGRYTP